jgi:hypothetical protein
MGCLIWLWLAPYIHWWCHVTDEYKWHIFIGDVASPTNIGRIWKPGVSFSLFPTLPLQFILNRTKLSRLRLHSPVATSTVRPSSPVPPAAFRHPAFKKSPPPGLQAAATRRPTRHRRGLRATRRPTSRRPAPHLGRRPVVAPPPFPRSANSDEVIWIALIWMLEVFECY